MTETTNKTGTNPNGYVLYDGACGFCTATALRMRPMIRAAGFRLAPLQDPELRGRLPLEDARLLEELVVLKPDNTLVTGADAFLHIAGFIPSAWPIRLLARLPGVMPLARRFYAFIAAHRQQISRACRLKPGTVRPERG